MYFNVMARLKQVNNKLYILNFIFFKIKNIFFNFIFYYNNFFISLKKILEKTQKRLHVLKKHLLALNKNRLLEILFYSLKCYSITFVINCKLYK